MKLLSEGGLPVKRYEGLSAIVTIAIGLSTNSAYATAFFYNGFSDTTGLSFVGSTATANTGDGTVLRLTPADFSQAGAAYSTSAVTLGPSDTFSTQFQFRFTNPGGTVNSPADGITFVIAASPSGLGVGGGSMGYGTVPNSVAIEFNTFDNGPGDGDSSNHVAVDTNGIISDLALSNLYNIQTCDFNRPRLHVEW